MYILYKFYIVIMFTKHLRNFFNFQSYSKCPGCLKVFRICTKCSTIDQILQKLK